MGRAASILSALVILMGMSGQVSGQSSREPAAAADDLGRLCRVVEKLVRDCGCTIAFLASNLSPQDGSLMLKLWAASLNSPQHRLEALIKEYGTKSFLEASWNFGKHRDAYVSQCRPSALVFTEQDWFTAAVSE
jgi:hypothetical protein